MADMTVTDTTDIARMHDAYWGGPGGPRWGWGPRGRWGGPWGPGRGGWRWGPRWGGPWGGWWRPYRWRHARWGVWGCCCPLTLLVTQGICATLLAGSLALVRRRRTQ